METCDIIFAGGGATACVTAGRLIAANPALRILILEAGPHTQDVPAHIQPARFITHLAPGSKTLSFNIGKPSESLLGRAPIVACGHAVGGGSSVNFLAYTRAAASDYDDWETIYENKGWGSDKLIPLLKKAETYQAEVTNDTHGTTGPIKVSFAKEHTNVGTNLLEVAAAYEPERGLTDDINAFTFCNKFGRWAKYIDSKTGRRSDAAHHYIYNQLHGTNLKVLVNSRVVRVIFEDKRAVGVEYIDEIGAEGPCVAQPVKVVKASRLVVLSSGAFGSPSILERSGIGGKEVLDKNGISQVVDLPGVGENYMDHVAAFVPYYGSPETESMDAVFRGRDGQAEYEKAWWENGSGPLALNGLDAAIKLRPSPQELKTVLPELNHRWETYFANSEDKPLLLMASCTGYLGKDPNVPIGKYFALGYFLTYPLATGRVHITSGLDPRGQFDFHPGFLDDVADLVSLRWAYKKSREYSRRMKYYRGEILSGHPKFPEGSAALCQSVALPVEISAPEITYTKEDDDAIDDFLRETVETSWHSCGTCAMKPLNQGGVVDERLNVYGVENLKVADLSITPGNVGANTYNTAIAIGEKAAFLIAQDLGIQGVTEL